MRSTFSRGLAFHVLNTTLQRPRDPLTVRAVLATLLVFLVAGWLMVLIGMS